MADPGRSRQGHPKLSSAVDMPCLTAHPTPPILFLKRARLRSSYCPTPSNLHKQKQKTDERGRDSNFKSKHTSKEHYTSEERQCSKRETTPTVECTYAQGSCEEHEPVRTLILHVLREKREHITALKQGQTIMK